MQFKSLVLIGFISLFVAGQTHAQNSTFTLQDFLKPNAKLDSLVALTFAQMDDTARVAQLIMPAAGRLGESNDKIEKYIK